MPIPSSINDLSTTAGSNSPAGSESPSLIDDYLRTYASYIAMLRDGAQTNAFNYAVAGGSANAITAAFSPAITTLADSTVLSLKSSATNTGATTFSPDGLAAKPIVRITNSPLTGGEIVTGSLMALRYSSALDSWVLIYASGVQGLSGKNLVLNGDFQVNQRAYAGGAAPTAAYYCFDRWQILISGQSASSTTSTTGPGRVVTAPAGGLMQPVDGSLIVAGVYSLNWSGTATVLVTQDTNALVTNLSVAKGGQVTLIAGQVVRLKFSSGTVSDVQFEFGPASTPFERLHVSAATAFCQRYFEVIDCAVVGYGVTGQIVGGAFNYKASKRATPTATLYSDGVLIANVNAGALTQQVYANQIIVYRNVTATGEIRWSDGYFISAEIA